MGSGGRENFSNRLDFKDVEERSVYFVPHPMKLWAKVLVLRRDEKKQKCRVRDLESGDELELSPKEIIFYMTNEKSVEDMTSLRHLHEPAILDNLEQRSDLREQRPYTSISNVLIAVNPLRKIGLPLVTDFQGAQLSSAPPHPWATAETAYRQMVLDGSTGTGDQSIVISGESGAGKTETAKMVLAYLCTVGSTDVMNGPDTDTIHLDRQLLESNPILEALGNAKTLRNNNSSRFGKFLKLEFTTNQQASSPTEKTNSTQFVLNGAAIETYLLERSRVVAQADGERNYHSLYQLVAGSTAHDAALLKLPRKARDFRYLRSSSCTSIEGVDDAKTYSAFRLAFFSAFPDPQVSKKLLALVTGGLAATLHLGNVSFDAVTTAESGDKASAVSTTDGAARPALNAVASTLELPEENATELLENLLLRHELKAGGTVYVKEHDVDTAEKSRDAVAKAMYGRIFDLVVAGLGDSMRSSGGGAAHYIGVLDIFGFESFERNDLEQLLINFANESLQATFNRAVLVAERALYAEEGLSVPGLTSDVDETKACEACVALIGDKRNSILAELDEATKTNKTDDFFCRALHSKLGDKAHYVPPHKKDKKDTFIIAHYAHNVKYTVGRFVMKNSDLVPEGLTDLLEKQALLFMEAAAVVSLPQVPGAVSSASSSSPQVIQPKKKTKNSLSSTFATQMRSLCALLDSTRCSFIRCLKPNPTMTVGLFEKPAVAAQLRAQGIPQTCEVLKCGLPTRVAYQDLESTYREMAQTLLAKDDQAKKRKPHNILKPLSPRQFATAVLWALAIPADAYSLGKTRVFFRTGKIALLDALYSVDLASDDGAWMLDRLRYFCARVKWRRALAKVFTARELIDRMHRLRKISRLARTLQIKYRYWANFGRGRLKRRIRRTWRRAYIKVRCLTMFNDEYRLIHETRLAREQAEREAAASVMEVKAAKRSAGAILAERVAKGQIPQDEADALLAKMQAKEEANKPAISSTDSKTEDDFDEDGLIEEGHEVPSPTGVDELLVGAASVQLDKVDARTAAAMKNAMRRLEKAKTCVFRWKNYYLFSTIKKWKAAITSVPTPRRGKSIRMSVRAMAANLAQQASIESDEDDSENHEEEDKLSDAWLKADLRRALSGLRDVLAKAPRLCDTKEDELNGPSLLELITPLILDNTAQKKASEPSKDSKSTNTATGTSDDDNEVQESKQKKNDMLDKLDDDEIWNRVFCAVGSAPGWLATGEKKDEDVPKADEPKAAAAVSSSKDDDADEGAITTLQQQIALLKKQLTSAGVQAVELVPLAEAREKMNAAVKRLMDGDMDAEKEVEKYDQIIRMHPDYEKEEAEKAQKWADDTRPTNLQAQREMRKLVPPDIRSASLKDLEDKGLPRGVVRRLWTKKATWLCRFHPDDIAKLHIADLLSKYNNQGLDIVEMRSCWASLPEEFDNDGDGKKAQWKANFRTKLMELCTKEEQKRLSKNEARNPGYKDADINNGYFDPDAPIVRAGILKSNPYAAQEKPVIKVNISAKAHFADDKKKDEKPKIAASDGMTSGIIDGKPLISGNTPRFIALVNGQIRAYAKESDLALEKEPDFSLSIRSRADDLQIANANDKEFTVSTKNADTKLTVSVSNASKWCSEIKAELLYVDPKEKLRKDREAKKKADEARRKQAMQQKGAAPGGLMAAIAGRGRGGPGGRSPARAGGLMDAIANRGRGGARGGGGRGGLLGALEARGRGAASRGRGGRPPARGGGLMDAIANRGRRG